MKLFSLSLIVPLQVGSNVFLFLLKTSTTVKNPDSAINVIGKEMMLASTFKKYFGVSTLSICR